MRIPPNADPDLAKSLREIWETLDRLGANTSPNLNLGGKRVTNAGKAEAMADYVTLAQALDLVKSGIDEQAAAAIAKEQAAFVERFTAAVRASTAPAAAANVPTWLADILTTLR